MRARLVPPVLLLSALAAAAVPACGFRKAPPPEESRAAAPAAPPPLPAAPVPAPATEPPAAPPAAPATSPADKAFADAVAARKDGQVERALELFSAALKENPDHPEASRGFDEALVALKKNGDAAYAQGKAEESGKAWMGTLRHIGSPAAKGKTYPFTRAEVQGQVKRLTAAQMEKGLLSYRKGEIPAAIAAWKTILAYDPDNEEAARSIRTASTQLENLRKIPPAK